MLYRTQVLATYEILGNVLIQQSRIHLVLNNSSEYKNHWIQFLWDIFTVDTKYAGFNIFYIFMNVPFGNVPIGKK